MSFRYMYICDYTFLFPLLDTTTLMRVLVSFRALFDNAFLPYQV